ncbi:JmjC domain-containing protein [Paraurantiacibacter namhicola]|uniref:JmjC domain-containing protein n=1 Tax=Paraurantiacibacter namhicola TaxID=645517 RepID=A0A1C7D9U4_9SPHN|nr:cupin domain-containing protein [Paraurantiacibacter namhicola]ANU08234.1 hypothetical protein A6F65_01942 [Paraurantiacibacter namhicola]
MRHDFHHDGDWIGSDIGVFDTDALAACYPDRAARFGHLLAHRQSLSWPAIRDALASGARSLMEVREDTPEGRFRPLADLPDDFGSLLDDLATAKRWIMLRDLARWPDFADVVAEIVTAIGPVAESPTGALLHPVAFLFVSSPGLLTPLHFDPEYNVLLQIAGSKHFTIISPEAGLPSPQDNEYYHASGDNLLEWSEGAARFAVPHELRSGDALHVPFKAAHTVTVGEEPSVSLSVTWRSRSSLLQDDAWSFNAAMRRVGVAMPPPGQYPWLRGVAMRALRRLRLA